MADISKIKLPSGDVYNLKDTSATHGMFFASYGNTTYAQVLAAYQAKEVVYCKASSGSNPASGSQTRLAFLAYVNNSENPTNFEFQYYRSVSSHTATQQGDQVYVYNLNSTSGWSVIVREAYSKVVAGTNLESSYSNSAITLNHSASGVTAASKGDTSDQTPGFGDTFKALSGTVDAQGHLTAFGEHTVTVPNSVVTTSADGLMSATDKADLEDLKVNTDYTRTISDSLVANCEDGSNFPASSVKVNIDVVQRGTGDPSSSNIRELVGWTEMDLRQAQGNLWGGDDLLADVKDALPAATVSAAYRYVSFAYNDTQSHVILGGLYGRGIRFKPDTQYTFILTLYKSSTTAANLRIYYTDGSYTQVSVPAAAAKYPVVVQTSSEKTVSSLEKYANGGTTRIYVDECGIFEGVHTLNEYMPYVGRSTKISWPNVGTVYGGILDVTKGELTVTHDQIASYDGELIPGNWVSDRDVSTPATYNDITSTLSIEDGGFDATVGSVISFTTTASWQRTAFVPIPGQKYRFTMSRLQNPSTFTYVVSADSQDVVLESVLSTSGFAASPETITTVAVFDSSVNKVYVKFANGGTLIVEEVNNGTPTTGAQVVYELEKPVVYQIDPIQITMYDGLNNLWANTGDVCELIYGKETFDPIAELVKAKCSDTTYALSISGNRLFLAPTIVNDVSMKLSIWFEKDRYTALNDGAIKSNSSYPYNFGESYFYRIKNPLYVTMGSDDFEYVALFYTSATSTNFLTDDGWHNGSEITCYDGIYNGNAYSYIRFDIRKTSKAYTQTDFEECIAAFSMKEYIATSGATTYIDLPIYDGTVVTS